jgi:hypothetical protein
MDDDRTVLLAFGDLHPLDQQKIFVNDKTGCWEWVAYRDKYGYGSVRRNGRVLKAHRYVYELFRGSINTNIHHLDHTCRVRWCVNPDHLEPVTAQMNAWRGVGSIEGDLPHDLLIQTFRLVQRAYKRGVLDGIRQAGPRSPS